MNEPTSTEELVSLAVALCDAMKQAEYWDYRRMLDEIKPVLPEGAVRAMYGLYYTMGNASGIGPFGPRPVLKTADGKGWIDD